MVNTAALEQVIVIQLIRELSAVTETEFQVSIRKPLSKLNPINIFTPTFSLT
jgi:hypothetical protein